MMGPWKRTDSGGPITVKPDENAELEEELVRSQDEFPGAHKNQREIAGNLGISKSSMRRLVKRKKSISLKEWKSHRWIMKQAECFDLNPRLVENFSFQDEKYRQMFKTIEFILKKRKIK